METNPTSTNLEVTLSAESISALRGFRIPSLEALSYISIGHSSANTPTGYFAERLADRLEGVSVTPQGLYDIAMEVLAGMDLLLKPAIPDTLQGRQMYSLLLGSLYRNVLPGIVGDLFSPEFAAGFKANVDQAGPESRYNKLRIK